MLHKAMIQLATGTLPRGRGYMTKGKAWLPQIVAARAKLPWMSYN
jgi:hypothetical protein